MKEKSMLRKWKNRLGLFLLALSPLLITGCLDNDDVQDLPPISYVSFYHGSPETGALSITVDGKLYNTNVFEYTDYFDYGNFYTGNRNFSFKPRNAANSLLDTAVNFVDNQVYSFFIVDGVDALETVIAEDDWDNPEVDHAMIRLVHLSPDAPAVSLQLEAQENDLFEGQSFTDVTDFEEIEAGRTSFVLKNAATGEVLLTADELNIRDRRVYSLVVRGYADPAEGSSSNHDLSIQLIRHYPDY